MLIICSLLQVRRWERFRPRGSAGAEERQQGHKVPRAAIKTRENR